MYNFPWISLNLGRILAQFSNQVWPSSISHIWQPVKFPDFDNFIDVFYAHGDSHSGS